MAVTGMNHFNILTDDVDATVDFYRDAVGLEPGPRPDLGFPGRVAVRGRHVRSCTSRRPAEASELKPGVIDHMAFSAHGPRRHARARSIACGIDYAHRRQQAGAGIWQVFFFDPNGARVELDFDPSEAEPAKAGAAPIEARCPHDALRRSREIDHLVFAAPTLAQGIEHIADLTGVDAASRRQARRRWARTTRS